MFWDVQGTVPPDVVVVNPVAFVVPVVTPKTEKTAKLSNFKCHGS